MNTFRCLFAFACLLLVDRLPAAETAPSLIGAWQLTGTTSRVMIVTAKFWTEGTFDREQRQFVRTLGGTYTVNDRVVSRTLQFDSENPKRVGTQIQAQLQTATSEMKLRQDAGSEEIWTRIDSGAGALAGTWRIGGRQVDGVMREMPLQARRTLKILSGTRFQWIAINVETGEFSGTGGGTYTLENGKYVETVEFMSRDNSRVGARLEFDAEVKDDSWQHRGLSSRGSPIHEVWTRFDLEQK